VTNDVTKEWLDTSLTKRMANIWGVICSPAGVIASTIVLLTSKLPVVAVMLTQCSVVAISVSLREKAVAISTPMSQRSPCKIENVRLLLSFWT